MSLVRFKVCEGVKYASLHIVRRLNALHMSRSAQFILSLQLNALASVRSSSPSVNEKVLSALSRFQFVGCFPTFRSSMAKRNTQSMCVSADDQTWPIGGMAVIMGYQMYVVLTLSYFLTPFNFVFFSFSTLHMGAPKNQSSVYNERQQ